MSSRGCVPAEMSATQTVCRLYRSRECSQPANVLSGRMSSADECPQRANVLARRMSSAGKCPHQANVLTRRMSSSTTIVFNNLDRKRITRCITLPCVLDTFQFADISTEEPSLPSYHTHRYSQLTSSRVHLRLSLIHISEPTRPY